MTNVAALEEKLGIGDLTKLTSKQINEILDKVRADEITKSEYTLLLSLVPGLAQTTLKYFEGFIAMSRAAGASQKAALDGAQKALDILKILAERTTTDKENENITDTVFKIASMIQNMSKDNNNFWLKVYSGGAATTVIILCLVGVITGRITLRDASMIVSRKFI